MAFISNKYKTLEERKKAVRSWYQQLLTEADASDSFYRDRWSELVDAYMDDLKDDEVFEEFYEDFNELLGNPGQHY